MHARRMISVVGCHAEGEVGDVITGGVPAPAGATMFEKMRTMEREHDHIRRMLLCEPRGGVGRHINLLTPPVNPECHAGVIIMEPTEYVPMSGSNTITTVTVLLETGIVPMVEPETVVMLDTPGGVVRVTAQCSGGRCRSVQFENVPCFVDRLDATIEVEEVGQVSLDVAYGGMFYALVDASRLGFEICEPEAKDLSVLGEKIRLAARAQLDVVHPENPDIRGVSIVQFNLPFRGPGSANRNTCIVSPGRCDRSPTGTGTCARMAVLHARGLMQVGDTLIHESIIGSRFEGRITGVTEIAGRAAITPTLRGRAWITGLHNYLLDPEDPYPQGYVLPDTWGVSGKITQ